MLRVWERAEDRDAPIVPEDRENAAVKNVCLIIGGEATLHSLHDDRTELTRGVPSEIRSGQLHMDKCKEGGKKPSATHYKVYLTRVQVMECNIDARRWGLSIALTMWMIRELVV
jgi:hypothetical protein